MIVEGYSIYKLCAGEIIFLDNLAGSIGWTRSDTNGENAVLKHESDDALVIFKGHSEQVEIYADILLTLLLSRLLELNILRLEIPQEMYKQYESLFINHGCIQNLSDSNSSPYLQIQSI